MSRNRRTFYGVMLVGLAALSACVLRPERLRSDASPADRLSGLYVSAADFEARRLTGAISCRSMSRPIDRHAFARAKVVAMPGARPEQSFAKASLFGFRACDGTDVRFAGGANLRVVRAAPLYMYENQYLVLEGKRGSRLVTEYSFSLTVADSVRPLTIGALKRAYPENHRFHDLLDMAFRSDAELARYDEFHREYRVARLLRESLP